MADRDDVATVTIGPPGRSTEAEHLPRGTQVGRYIIIDPLGAGGMGVVYSAFDPELDRKVAIKLLQASPTGGSSGGDQAWLVREAQAMARLSHPNVVAVHDVGTLAGDRVFVAMDLVEGVTLRQWLEEPRSWREVISVMRAAGAGLAAAHSAGLVHRDFKPDNVLIGKDGRVCVMDFGLARLQVDRSRDSDPKLESPSPLSATLTVAGHVIGTPAYMPPEMYQGAAEARSDQFAFGVALYEALYRMRPFDQKLRPRPDMPRPKEPPEAGVPVRIRRAVMRAIDPDVERRWASIDDLLAELAFDVGARRRRVLIAAGIVIAVGAVGVTYWLSRSQDRTCTGAEQRLAGIWDPPIKQTIRAAFAATKRSFAERSFAGLEHALDGYVGEWTKASVGSCEATRIRGEQTEEVLSLRQACLDQRLAELRALTGLLAKADAAIVDKGDKIAFELEPIERCANVTMLRMPARPPVGSELAFITIQAQLADARAQVIAGEYLAALVSSQHAIDAAKQINYAPLEAEATMVYADAMFAVGNGQQAAAKFAEAAYAAVRGRRDDIAAEASFSAALLASDQLGHPAEAKMWLELAKASAIRVGIIDRALELRRLEVEGLVLAQAGDLNAAIATHEQALAVAETVRGPASPALWTDEQLLAATLIKAGLYTKAISHLERALSSREASVGPDHQDLAFMLSNLGSCYAHLHDGKKARAAFERALAIREKAFGPNSPLLVAPLNNMADYLRTAGDLAGALATIERAKQIGKLVPGIDHPLYHTVETTYAEVLAAAGRTSEARKAYDELLVLEAKTSSATTATTLTSRGDFARGRDAWQEAATFYERAIAVAEGAGGNESPELWRPLTGLAQAKIGLGDNTAAKPLLERALAIGAKAQIDAVDLEPTRTALARVSR